MMRSTRKLTRLRSRLLMGCVVLLACLSPTVVWGAQASPQSSPEKAQPQAIEVDLLKHGAQDTAEPGRWLLGDMLEPYRDGHLWRTPEGPQYNRAVTSRIDVKPATRYLLRWGMQPALGLKLMVFATFHDEAGQAGPLIHLMSFENSSAYWNLDKPIIVPHNAHAMVITLAFSGMTFKEKMNIGYMSSMKLVEEGSVAFDPVLAEHYDRNLLPVGTFDGFEAGPVERSALGLMPFGQKSFDTSIIADESGKALRVHYRPGDYQYVAWFTPELPLYRQTGWLTCRIRGQGRVQLMVWWNRPSIHSIYKHFGFFDLTSEYQDITIAIGCDDPLTRRAVVAVACRDNETTFDLASVSFHLHRPPAKR